MPIFFKKATDFIVSYKFVFGLYILLPIVITTRQFILMQTQNESSFFFINNYLIFKNAYLNLIQYKDLYIYHNDIQIDLYKYSPSFAVFMMPFAYLPDWLGVFSWLILNVLGLLFAVKALQLKAENSYCLLALFMLQELITASMNLQSNALMAALMIGGYVSINAKKPALGTLFWMIAVFIKPFALAIYLFFFLSDQKIKIAGFSILWAVVIALAPLAFVSIDQYIFLLNSWKDLLAADHSSSFGISVMGLIDPWIPIGGWKTGIVALGILLQCLPLVRIKMYDRPIFQLSLLASVLIWTVIFNHKAESPTFIIAVAGIGIWFFSKGKKTTWDYFLLWFTIILTQFSPTDIFPHWFRSQIIDPYNLKALPCVLCWVTMMCELYFSKFEDKSQLQTA